MSSLQSLRTAATDPEWRYPLLAGVVSGLTVAVQYWRTPTPAEPVDATAVFLAGLLGGALFHATGASRRIGFRTGLVAGLATIPGVARMLAAIAGFGQPAWFTAVQRLLGVVLLVLLVGLSGVVGWVGAALGNRLAGVAVRSRSQGSSKSAAKQLLSRSASDVANSLNGLLASQTGLTRQCRRSAFAQELSVLVVDTAGLSGDFGVSPVGVVECVAGPVEDVEPVARDPDADRSPFVDPSPTRDGDD